MNQTFPGLGGSYPLNPASVPPGVDGGTSADDQARFTIPSIESLKTQYRPHGQWIMVVPLPSITKHGALHLPDRAQMPMNEGHIVAKGPAAPDELKVGDCIMWDPNSEFRLNIDDKAKFVLVTQTNVIMRIPREQLELELEMWKKLPQEATKRDDDLIPPPKKK